MILFALLKQPSLRRLLSFLLVAGAVSLGLAFFLWCPVQCWRVRQYLARGQLGEASSLVIPLATHHRKCAECQYLEAKVMRRQGDFRFAIQSLDRAAALSWDAEDISRERVLASVQTGKILALGGELKSIFATDLDAAETEEVYEAMALGHLAAFDGPEFQQCLDYWLEWNPQAVKPRLLRAQFDEQLGNHFEAAKHYKTLLQDHSECLEARLGWGACLLKLNQPAEAEMQLRLFLSQRREPKAAVLLSKCLVQTGQSAEARTLLNEFHETPKAVDRAEVLEELGRLCVDQGQAAEAVGYLEESVRLAPEAAPAWHSLSSAYSLQGNLEKSKQALATSQESLLRLQRLGVIVVELSTHPEALGLRIEAAQILFKQGMDLDAVAWLNTIISREAHHRQAHELLAQYYEKQGNSKLAEHHRRFGEDSSPDNP